MNLHVIIGEDDYLVSETAKKTVGNGEGLELIDSRNSTNADLQLADIRRVEESVRTESLFDPRKVTWWKNVHFLPRGGNDKVAAEVKVALEKFVLGITAIELPENHHFIITGPHLLKASKVAKALAGKAELITFSAGKPWELARETELRVTELAGEMGLRFAAGAASAFVGIVGFDTRSLISELGKMRDYLGPGKTEITTADVRDITSAGVQDDPMPWDVTDAVGARNIPKALEAMKRFELENGFEVMMTTVIEKLFRQLYDMKAAEARGDLEEATAGMAPNVVRKNTRFLGSWTLRELRVARARFLELREKVVSGTNAGRFLVVTELLRVMRRQQKG